MFVENAISPNLHVIGLFAKFCMFSLDSLFLSSFHALKTSVQNAFLFLFMYSSRYFSPHWSKKALFTFWNNKFCQIPSVFNIFRIHVDFNAIIKALISIIFRPPSSKSAHKVSRLILSGLLFHRNSNIVFRISFINLSLGSGSEMNKWLNWEIRRDFINEIFPTGVKFLFFHCFSIVSILCNISL